ncbi:hypothetical protein CHISP_3437 [Chitinispirillum alkaliphilum]|nr:hypothetical protein CHISP_3437 [Chitinispirillum alkaliphilum]
MKAGRATLGAEVKNRMLEGTGRGAGKASLRAGRADFGAGKGNSDVGKDWSGH